MGIGKHPERDKKVIFCDCKVTSATARPAMPWNTPVLPVPAREWQPPTAGIQIDGTALAPKPELHITLIGSALSRELQETFAEPFLDAAIDLARAAQDWHFTRTGIRLLLRRPYVESGTRVIAHSLIELIELPAMAHFHHALGRLLGRQLPVPPPHVTLYTAGRAQGIGVSSPHRLRAFTVKVASCSCRMYSGGQSRFDSRRSCSLHTGGGGPPPSDATTAPKAGYCHASSVITSAWGFQWRSKRVVF